MELRKYQKETRSLEVKLGGGETLKLEYLPNYMTGENLKAVDEARKKSLESNLYLDQQEVLAGQVALVVQDVDITLDDEKVPFGTLDERVDILRQLSYQDLERIDDAVRAEITRPLA